MTHGSGHVSCKEDFLSHTDSVESQNNFCLKGSQEGSCPKLMDKTGPALTIFGIAFGMCQNLKHHDQEQVFKGITVISVTKVNTF